MIASGSTEGSEYGRSPVATSFTQSVEPGSGDSSTLMPAAAYQPNLLGIAKGAAAEVTVRAHQPTLIVVCACSLAVIVSANTAAAPRNRLRVIAYLPSHVAGRHWPFPTGPRTGRGGGRTRCTC